MHGFGSLETRGRSALIMRAARRRSRAMGTDDPNHWSRQGANYNGDDCANCGRQRVLLYEPVARRICEKCNWDQDANDYAVDHERIG